MARPFKIGNTEGYLKRFIIEPFVEHTDEQELYCAIYGTATGDRILFHHQGGVDIGDVDSKAKFIDVNIEDELTHDTVLSLLTELDGKSERGLIADFLVALFSVYRKLFFTYMEINPLVVRDGKVFILDLAAKVDQVLLIKPTLIFIVKQRSL